MNDIIINEMNIELERVNSSDRYKIEKMMQLYLHDLGVHFPIEFDSEICEYRYKLDKYFEDQHAYLIKDGNNILGFMLVDNYIDYYEISEIFILNNYKGKGIGEKAVNKIFDQFKGRWVIKTVPNSLKAEKFWLKTISDYTRGKYELNRVGKYNRAEFVFDNTKR
jgi:predicted acetyltransferase